MNTFKKIILSTLMIAGMTQTPVALSNQLSTQQECVCSCITISEFAITLRKTNLEYYNKVATLLEDYARNTRDTSHIDTIINDETLFLDQKAEMIAHYINHYNDEVKAAEKKAEKQIRKSSKTYYANRIKETKAVFTGGTIMMVAGMATIITFDNVLKYYFQR